MATAALWFIIILVLAQPFIIGATAVFGFRNGPSRAATVGIAIVVLAALGVGFVAVVTLGFLLGSGPGDEAGSRTDGLVFGAIVTAIPFLVGIGGMVVAIRGSKKLAQAPGPPTQAPPLPASGTPPPPV